jgi:glucan phosphorylase
MAAAYTVRDRLLDRWIRTAQTYKHAGARTVCYLSAEYLLGPHLGNNVLNLGILGEVRQAAQELGVGFDKILDQEEEPGLGNGGLGRLAACYLDSPTSSASSTRRYTMAGKRRSPTSGCATAIPGNWPGRSCVFLSHSAGTPSTTPMRRGD